MSPEVLKQRFDAVAGTLWLGREELGRLSAQLVTGVGRNAAKSVLTDLLWASENCTVLGLHAIGKVLDDKDA
ncbi:MAG: hypothetical protein ACRC7O_03075 [Fimbriiglobus sp.]